MNRQQRRRRGGPVADEDFEVTALEFSVCVAIELNRRHPVPGAEAELYAIRAQFGPWQMIRVERHLPGIQVIR